MTGEGTRDGTVRTEVVMGTLVTIHVVRCGADAAVVETAIDRAFGWFHEIERRCTRFSGRSELMQLCAQAGVAHTNERDSL